MWGAALNPPDAKLGQARTVVFAVKPQAWRGVAKELAPRLSAEAVIVSIVAGVEISSLAAAFGSRPVARAMPTTAAALACGAASLWSEDAAALPRARALFSALGDTVELGEEAQMHVATAASGSAPAYAYALVEALQAAAEAEGLSPENARTLARSALMGAAALLKETGEEASELRRQVTSPGGTTEAGLKVLLASEGGLHALMKRTVAAAAQRSRELSAA